MCSGLLTANAQLPTPKEPTRENDKLKKGMAYLIIYFVGVVVGLALMRDRWPARVVTALVWPLGPAAFVVVVAILAVMSAILWPVPILTTAAIVGLFTWLFATAAAP
jgi:hypothetical protein